MNEVEIKNTSLFFGGLGLTILALISQMDIQPPPMPDLEGYRLGETVAELHEGYVLDNILLEQLGGYELEQMQLMLEGYDIVIEETIDDLIVESRWNFPTEVKEMAWNREVQEGRIPEGARWEDYSFHHLIPSAVAQERGLSYYDTISVENCMPLPIGWHVVLHREYTLEELADFELDHVVKQPRLIND